jgi:hypothetical protein
LRYSCGHVSTKKNVRGIKDAAASTPPQLRSSRYIRYRDNIGYPRYGERYDIGDNQYSSNNLSYCPINRFLESVTTLTSWKRSFHRPSRTLSFLMTILANTPRCHTRLHRPLHPHHAPARVRQRWRAQRRRAHVRWFSAINPSANKTTQEARGRPRRGRQWAARPRQTRSSGGSRPSTRPPTKQHKRHAHAGAAGATGQPARGRHAPRCAAADARSVGRGSGLAALPRPSQCRPEKGPV